LLLPTSIFCAAPKSYQPEWQILPLVLGAAWLTMVLWQRSWPWRSFAATKYRDEVWIVDEDNLLIVKGNGLSVEQLSALVEEPEGEQLNLPAGTSYENLNWSAFGGWWETTDWVVLRRAGHPEQIKIIPKRGLTALQARHLLNLLRAKLPLSSP
jgi:hypothetical protein